MDNKNTIEISRDAFDEVLPMLEGKLAQLGEELERAQGAYDRTAKTISELRAKKNGAQHSLPAGNSKKRKKRGEGQKAVIELLKALAPGTALSMADIAKRTGVAYSSIFRFLKKKNNGRFIEENGQWKMKS
jgi:transposase